MHILAILEHTVLQKQTARVTCVTVKRNVKKYTQVSLTNELTIFLFLAFPLF